MAFFGRKAAKPEKSVAAPANVAKPVISLILADIAVRAGGAMLRQSIERNVMKGKTAQGRLVRGRTLTETVVGTVLIAVARRSVPGAILIGGGMLAKSLSDRRRARMAGAAKIAAKPSTTKDAKP